MQHRLAVTGTVRTVDDVNNADGSPEVELDARFILANERTLLAWIRTCLALLAAGVAVEQLGSETTSRTTVSLLLLAAGLLSLLLGSWRYRAADSAMRAGQLPSTGWAIYGVVVMVAVAAVVAAIFVLAT